MNITKRKLLPASLLALGLAASLLAACSQSGSDKGSGAAGKTAGHDSVAKFDALTAAQCDGVRSLKIFFQHASVGQNIYSGVTGLSSIDAAKYALTTEQFSAGYQSDLKAWLGTHAGWADYYEGNPGWDAKVSDFTANARTQGIAALVDVAMMKFCFIDQDTDFATYRDAMVALQTACPTTTFVWWTMPLFGENDADNAKRNAFNQSVRAYVAAHDLWLYDIADIESHDPDGGYHLDSVGGAYLWSGYTSDGGHLNDDGSTRAGKAMWVLLSLIAESQ
jgi:hypothetical protein